MKQKNKINTKKLTTKEFIEKAKKIHGDKYDYNKVEYTNNKTKVCIVCPIHGEFWQKPNNHLNGHGCPKCARKITSIKNTVTNEEFIKKVWQYIWVFMTILKPHIKVQFR